MGYGYGNSQSRKARQCRRARQFRLPAEWAARFTSLKQFEGGRGQKWASYLKLLWTCDWTAAERVRKDLQGEQRKRKNYNGRYGRFSNAA